MTNVVFVSRHLSNKGGVINYVRTLMSLLPEEEFHQDHFAQSLPPNYPRFTRISLPIFYLWQRWKFSKFLKEDPQDVVHINSTMGWLPMYRDILFARSAKKHDVPVLFFIHGWRWPFYNTLKKHRILRKRLTNDLNKMDRIFVLSRDFKDALTDIGVKEEKTVITSTMVDTEKYHQDEKEFRRPYKILFCSNILKVKGIYELLEAADILLKEHSDIRFVFVGQGPELDNLKAEACKLKISHKIDFTGYVSDEDKIKLFKGAHIFAFPTYHGEGFPTVILEAMAAGLPIVTTNNAALKHAFKDGVNGLLLSSMPAKPEEIAKKISDLINDLRTMRKMSDRNMEEAKMKYDINVVADTVFQAYRDISRNKM